MSEPTRYELPNGSRLLVQRMEGIRSAAFGIWVESGSRDEKAAENGSAHYMEHMIFKGGAAGSASQLAMKMDELGGQVNAFTTREYTCFYARVPDYRLDDLTDLLFPMVFRPWIRPEDVETERGVILEEMGMYSDDPSDLVGELTSRAIYAGNPLCRPILGTPASLKKLTADSLRQWHTAHYGAERIFVTLVGAFEDAAVERLKDRLSALPNGHAAKRRSPTMKTAVILKKKRTEQNHIQLTWPGLPLQDKRRAACQLFSDILAGGMSSRLFQEVREKRGLCYAIAAPSASYRDAGDFSIYTAAGRETEAQALEAIAAVLRELQEHGVTEEELARAKELNRASMLLSLESTSFRMNRLAVCELMQPGFYQSPEQSIERMEQVTAEQIRSFAVETLRPSLVTLAAVGRLRPEEEYRAFLSSLG